MFTVADGKGFSANALLECDMKLVASWESIEIVGTTVQEPLIPTGLYTLQISIAYRSTTPVDVTVDCSIVSDGVALKSKRLTFSGKKPDIGRAIAVVRIQK